MGLHPNFWEFVTTLASNEESDAYLNFCQMVRVCANLGHICIQTVSIYSIREKGPMRDFQASDEM